MREETRRDAERDELHPLSTDPDRLREPLLSAVLQLPHTRLDSTLDDYRTRRPASSLGQSNQRSDLPLANSTALPLTHLPLANSTALHPHAPPPRRESKILKTEMAPAPKKKALKIGRALKRLPARVSGGRGNGGFVPLPGELPVVLLRVQVLSCTKLLAKDRNGSSDP